VRISGSNAGYTMFRGSVKSTGYPLHSTFSPSLPLPCVTVCHHILTRVYCLNFAIYPSHTTASTLILISCVCPSRGLHCGHRGQRSKVVYKYRWHTCHKLRATAFGKHQGREFFLCSNVRCWSVSNQPSSGRDVFQTPCFRWGT
jgi:hypothetical protein